MIFHTNCPPPQKCWHHHRYRHLLYAGQNIRHPPSSLLSVDLRCRQECLNLCQSETPTGGCRAPPGRARHRAHISLWLCEESHGKLFINGCLHESGTPTNEPCNGLTARSQQTERQTSSCERPVSSAPLLWPPLPFCNTSFLLVCLQKRRQYARHPSPRPPSHSFNPPQVTGGRPPLLLGWEDWDFTADTGFI